MFRRGLHKKFPIFFSYLLFEFSRFAFLFFLHDIKISPASYTNIDLFFRIGSIALRFGILQEALEASLGQNMPLRRAMARVMNWATFFLVAVASIFIVSLYYSILNHRTFVAYVIVQALNTAQCGLLALVFAWHRFLGLRMSPMVFGILFGMGLAIGAEPLIMALKDTFGIPGSTITDLAQFAAFHIAAVSWLYFAQVREKVSWATETSALPDLRQWAADMGRIAQL
jgi:hypothetical protein